MSATLELQRALLPVAVVVFIVSGCGGSHHNGASGTVSVDADGRIGLLRVDVSDRRAVVAFAGHPAAERRGRNTRASPFGSARYDALGYDCNAKVNPHSYALPLVDGGPFCQTVFFIHRGRLGLFYTTQSRYVERHGIHVGMATGKAERLLHPRVIPGCIDPIELTRPGRKPLLRFISTAARSRTRACRTYAAATSRPWPSTARHTTRGCSSASKASPRLRPRLVPAPGASPAPARAVSNFDSDFAN
jgi:hypothetical protein